MGKKRARKSKTSKALRPNQNNSITKALARDTSFIDKMLAKADAWLAGKNPWITVPGADKKHAFVRVRANSFYGDHKYSKPNIYRGKSDE